MRLKNKKNDSTEQNKYMLIKEIFNLENTATEIKSRVKTDNENKHINVKRRQKWYSCRKRKENRRAETIITRDIFFIATSSERLVMTKF